ncbi:MAG: GntR family transcriptional regulator [Candidatus Firestonebacteria bacterium]
METALYKKIEESIKEKIRAQGFPSGKLPPERALLLEYGVSRDTLRVALAELVRQGLLLSLPRKGNFVNSRGAGAAGPSKTNLGILYLSKASSPLNRISCVFKGIDNIAGKFKFKVQYYLITEERTEDLKKELLEENIRAVLLLQPLPQKFLRWLSENNIRVITVNFYYGTADISLSAVVPDQQKAGFLAAKHLLDLGCRRTGIILDSLKEEYGNIRVSYLVKNGYIEALKARGLVIDEALIKCGEWDRSSIRKDFEGLLEKKVDGLVCSSELVLEKLLEVLREKKIVPGRELKLVSLCEKDRIYPFPTVGLPYVELGESAVMLANMLINNNAGPQKIVLDTVLRV